MALLAVIGVTVAVTISVISDENGNGADPSGNTYGLASADDKGPANIITEDPTCAAWRRTNANLAESQKEWGNRDPSVPAAEWTPEERSQYEAAGQALRNAADQTVQLAKLTPHRVVRELYEQFIAYARAYADVLPTYTAADNHLVGVALTTSGAVTFACTAIEWDSAQTWAPLIPAPAPPSKLAGLSDPNDPQRFLKGEDPICSQWDQLLNQYTNETLEWQSLDPNIPASSWTAEQRAVIDAVTPTMSQHANELENLGRSSANPIVQDFAVFAAQYRRAYVATLPNYTPADSYLSRASNRASTAINEACKAVGN
ncbi:hypothetical protein [Mycolicibacterium sp. XJ879]